jgi:IclR helix-turn-helix domain
VSRAVREWVETNGPSQDNLRDLLSVFAERAEGDGTNSSPGLRYLSSETGLSAAHVRRLIAVLVDEGWLEKTANAGGRANSACFTLVLTRCSGQPVGNPVGKVERRAQGARPWASQDVDSENVSFNESKVLKAKSNLDLDECATSNAPAQLALVPSEIESLCSLLASRIEGHFGRAPKQSSAWALDMDRLLRLGPTTWAKPEPITAARIERVIDGIFDRLSVRSSSGFSWADQIRSPGNLRKQWDRLVQELNSTIAAGHAPRRGYDRNAGANAVLAELREAGQL